MGPRCHAMRSPMLMTISLHYAEGCSRATGVQGGGSREAGLLCSDLLKASAEFRRSFTELRGGYYELQAHSREAINRLSNTPRIGTLIHNIKSRSLMLYERRDTRAASATKPRKRWRASLNTLSVDMKRSRSETNAAAASVPSLLQAELAALKAQLEALQCRRAGDVPVPAPTPTPEPAPREPRHLSDALYMIGSNEEANASLESGGFALTTPSALDERYGSAGAPTTQWPFKKALSVKLAYFQRQGVSVRFDLDTGHMGNQYPHPSCIKEWKDNVKKWPDVRSPQIIYYLLHTKAYELEDVKAYKSLDSYNYFKSGWVGAVLVHEVDATTVLLKGTVQGSQSVNKTNDVWLCAKMDGEVITAGCTCMAGQARVCSHIGAVLWKVDFAASSGLTGHGCTDEAMKWNRGTKRNVVPASLHNIGFKLEKGIVETPDTYVPEAKQLRVFRNSQELREYHATAPFQGLFQIHGKYRPLSLKNICTIGEK
ncbi:hypothetical protein HPB47_011735 [Ixodes persulcatus]|uniref:Uncharacterized protein n=1 Tax=Ixodes persulcatus TaxID=34615 RepID=A0AC60NVF2_IXOPE|nr:hypothetical protein HPB47_011735 [Ixodes persulcatus]